MLKIKLTSNKISIVELVKNGDHSRVVEHWQSRIRMSQNEDTTSMEAEENLKDWDHEDAGGGVGDPHGEQHGGHHEAKHDHPGGGPKKAQH